MKRLRRFLQPLHAGDITTIVFLAILSLLIIVFRVRIPGAPLLLAANIGSCLAIYLICRGTENGKGILRVVRDFYAVPGILLIFKEMYILVPSINPTDYDWLFIRIDHWMFGVHPTQWLYRFAHPVFTEILQIAYSLFYLLLVIIGVDFYFRKKREDFEHGFFVIVYGFYLSYLGYLLLPAVGPRFTLHDFSALPTDLPGLLLTSPLRSLINFGESIPDGTVNPMAFVQRDVFPSGHAQMTLVIMYLAGKYRARTRWFLWITGALLIIGTVYLRYHYVVDLIGGALFMLFTIWSAPHIERRWNDWAERRNGGDGPP